VIVLGGRVWEIGHDVPSKEISWRESFIEQISPSLFPPSHLSCKCSYILGLLTNWISRPEYQSILKSGSKNDLVNPHTICCSILVSSIKSLDFHKRRDTSKDCRDYDFKRSAYSSNSSIYVHLKDRRQSSDLQDRWLLENLLPTMYTISNQESLQFDIQLGTRYTSDCRSPWMRRICYFQYFLNVLSSDDAISATKLRANDKSSRSKIH
jgi:hypothetical protein